jgi:hypothetical protein
MPMDGGVPITGTPVAGTVTVNKGTTVGKIAPGYLGFSYEKSHLTDSFFTGSNAPLIALSKLLGPGILRLGGNSVDATSWQPTAAPTTGGTIGTHIGTADVDGLADFLNATGWKTIYAVNLKTSTPAAAAAEATYAANKLAGSIYSFEIGNEIDHYAGTYAQKIASWEGEASAISGAVPNAPLSGPATGTDWKNMTVPFAKSEAGKIFLLTQHYYRGNGKSPSATMAQLLAPDPGLVTMLQALAAASTANNISGSYRLDECNSYFAHGAPNVSDAFGAALWAIDFLFIGAENGSSGVNFHGGGPGQDGPTPFLYTPIQEMNGAVTGVQPIFYGILAFALAGNGNVLQTTAHANALNFTAYAVGQEDGSTNVVLDNKDATSAISASVDLDATVTSASAVYLLGPSLAATTGVTLAGGTVSAAGAWSPSEPWSLPVSGNVVTVVLPPASAAIVHAQ